MAFHTSKWKEPSHRVHYFLWHQRKFKIYTHHVPVFMGTSIYTGTHLNVSNHRFPFYNNKFMNKDKNVKLKCLKIYQESRFWNWWKTQPKKWSKNVKLLLISWKKTRNLQAVERRWLSFSLRLFGSRFGDIAAEGLLVKYEWCLLLLWGL